MPSANIYFPTEESREKVMNGIAGIAKERGFYTIHQQAERGNIRELLESIVDGETALVLLSEEHRLVATSYLKRFAKELQASGDRVDWIASNAFNDVAAALECHMQDA